MEFYKCERCGNIIAFVENKGVPVSCCGQNMVKIEPNTVDAAKEKHVPVIMREGNKVTVTIGSAPHPMIPAHHISWIALQTKQGNQRKELPVEEPAQACFELCDGDEVIAVYEYCNLHGLWKADA